MRVTFFQSGKPQQISPPDPFGFDDDANDANAAAAAGDEPPAWKQFDPLDPDFEQHHQHRLLHHQHSADDYPNSDDADTVDTSSRHLNSMTAATAQLPSYDRQMR